MNLDNIHILTFILTTLLRGDEITRFTYHTGHRKSVYIQPINYVVVLSILFFGISFGRLILGTILANLLFCQHSLDADLVLKIACLHTVKWKFPTP